MRLISCRTVLGLCGVAAPDGLEGTDFPGAAAGSEQAPGLAHRRGARLSLPVPITEARRFGFAEYRGVRTEEHTYVRSIHGPWLLYDNRGDAYQMHNLCGQAAARETQTQLDGELDAMLKQRGDDFLPAAEYVKRAGVGHYREVNQPVGHTRSAWGDWESTDRAAGSGR